MATYEIATPTAQQVLELRRLRAEAGLEPFDHRRLSGQSGVVLEGERAAEVLARFREQSQLGESRRA